MSKRAFVTTASEGKGPRYTTATTTFQVAEDIMPIVCAIFHPTVYHGPVGSDQHPPGLHPEDRSAGKQTGQPGRPPRENLVRQRWPEVQRHPADAAGRQAGHDRRPGGRENGGT